MHWHEQSTAHSKDNAPQRFQITHPYHPLFQQEFVLVQYRRNWGEDRVYFPAENRVSTGNAYKTERSGGNTWTKRFWTAADLADKLRLFQDYFNRQRVHSGLEGRLPEPGEAKVPLNFASYRWQQHCRGLFQTPIAA